MSDSRSKPAIPAWQRTALTKPPPTEDPVSSQPESVQSEASEELREVEVEEPVLSSEELESVPANNTSPTTAPPAESVAGEKSSAFAVGDLEAFKHHQYPRREPLPSSVQQQAPPIITYPEFLVEAHKPPPFITPGRILNTLYVAGSAAALLYGASTLLVNPMVESLSQARHEYFNHTQSKLDDFNDRLSKIVSKIPPPKKTGTGTDAEVDEVESVTSDPIELYHRDIGTQTSEPLLPRQVTLAAVEKKDAVTDQTGALVAIREHIDEMSASAERNAGAYKDRQEKMNKLRHYLDGLIYGSHSLNAWQTTDDAVTVKKDGSEDPVEDLKKEIRAVKGVLLSAKRFAAVSRPISGAA